MASSSSASMLARCRLALFAATRASVSCPARVSSAASPTASLALRAAARTAQLSGMLRYVVTGSALLDGHKCPSPGLAGPRCPHSRQEVGWGEPAMRPLPGWPRGGGPPVGRGLPAAEIARGGLSRLAAALAVPADERVDQDPAQPGVQVRARPELVEGRVGPG